MNTMDDMAAFLDVYHTSVKCLRSQSCLEAIFKLRLGRRSQLSGGLWAILSGTEDGMYWSRKGWSGNEQAMVRPWEMALVQAESHVKRERVRFC